MNFLSPFNITPRKLELTALKTHFLKHFENEFIFSLDYTELDEKIII
jgi:hypothetical protein